MKKKTEAKAVKPVKSSKTKPRTPVSRTKENASSGSKLAALVAQGMYEKKGENIRILDMSGIPGASSDFFVISHASSDKQVEAIAESAEEEVHKKTGLRPSHREGFENLEWVLLDYFDVVAHVFTREKREFYAVEELWGDAEEVPFKGK